MTNNVAIFDEVDIQNIIEKITMEIVENYKKYNGIPTYFYITYKGWNIHRTIYDYIDGIITFLKKYKNDIKYTHKIDVDRLIEKIEEYRLDYSDL